jgi:hypothetical protein
MSFGLVSDAETAGGGRKRMEKEKYAAMIRQRPGPESWVQRIPSQTSTVL